MHPARGGAATVQHLLVPLLASTLTTVLAFVPIAASPGSVGEFIGTIGLTVILALVSSLCLSLTVIVSLVGLLRQWEPLPITWAWWHHGLSHHTWPSLPLDVAASVPAALAGHWAVAGSADGGLCRVCHPAPAVFPPTNRDQFQIEFELPTQTAMAATQQQVMAARDLALQHPEVKDIHWFLGRSAPSFFYNVVDNRRNAQNYAQGIVQLTTTENLRQTIQTLQTELDRAFPDAQVLVKQLEQGPPFDAPIELRVYGADMDGLRELGNQLRAELAQVEDVIHTRANLTAALPKLALQVDEAQAQRIGPG
jgi:multidrug efflux pump subunit AcrB